MAYLGKMDREMSIIDAPQILTTSSRLCLRSLAESDGNALFHYRNQPDVSLFQGWTPASPEEVSAYAREMASRPFAAPGFWYQVILQLQSGQTNAGDIIGDVAFCIDAESQQQAELGIALDTHYQRKGYAQEAVVALVNYLFATFQLHRIHVSIDPRNTASRKLMERVGFRFEGHLKQSVLFKGEWCDDMIMAVLRSEWPTVDRQ